MYVFKCYIYVVNCLFCLKKKVPPSLFLLFDIIIIIYMYICVCAYVWKWMDRGGGIILYIKKSLLLSLLFGYIYSIK